MTVYKVVWRDNNNNAVLFLEPDVADMRRRHPVAHAAPMTIEEYAGAAVFLVIDTNQRDYYGSTQLVAVHRTYEGAARELERLQGERGARTAAARDLELGVDFLKD